MTEYSIIMSTFPNKESAEKCISNILTNELAACVHLLPIESRYKWKGELIQDSEVVIHIKTLKNKYYEIEQLIIKMHPYELPEIIEIPLSNGLKNYLNWIGENVK